MQSPAAERAIIVTRIVEREQRAPSVSLAELKSILYIIEQDPDDVLFYIRCLRLQGLNDLSNDLRDWAKTYSRLAPIVKLDEGAKP